MGDLVFNDADKVNLLFKKSIGFASTQSTLQFNNESLKSFNVIFPDHIWPEINQVPLVPPTLANLATYGTPAVLQYFDKLQLSVVAGSGDKAYYSSDLKDIIPFSYGDYVNRVELFTSTNAPLQFGNNGGDWIIDPAAGLLTFHSYNMVDSLVDSSKLPKISFYKYVGLKGIGGTPNSAGQFNTLAVNTLTVNTSANINGSVSFSGILNIANDINITGPNNLSVGGSADITSNLNVGGNTNISGPLTLTGTNDLTVGGNITCQNLTVQGTTTTIDSTTVTIEDALIELNYQNVLGAEGGGIRVHTGVNTSVQFAYDGINWNTSEGLSTGNINVTGNITLSNGIVVTNGGMVINAGGLDLTGDLIHAGNYTTSGNITCNTLTVIGTTNNDSDYITSGNLYIGGNEEITGSLDISGAITHRSDYTTSGNIDCNNLSCNDLTVRGTTTTVNSTTVTIEDALIELNYQNSLGNDSGGLRVYTSATAYAQFAYNGTAWTTTENMSIDGNFDTTIINTSEINYKNTSYTLDFNTTEDKLLFDLDTSGILMKVGSTESITIHPNGNISMFTNSDEYELNVLGTINATHVLTHSDERIKERIYDIDKLDCLNNINKIKLKSFYFKPFWISNSKQKNVKNIGIIAQDLVKDFPDYVSIRKNDVKIKDDVTNENIVIDHFHDVNWEQIYKLSIGAIQELSNRVIILENNQLQSELQNEYMQSELKNKHLQNEYLLSELKNLRLQNEYLQTEYLQNEYLQNNHLQQNPNIEGNKINIDLTQEIYSQLTIDKLKITEIINDKIEINNKLNETKLFEITNECFENLNNKILSISNKFIILKDKVNKNIIFTDSDSDVESQDINQDYDLSGKIPTNIYNQILDIDTEYKYNQNHKNNIITGKVTELINKNIYISEKLIDTGITIDNINNKLHTTETELNLLKKQLLNYKQPQGGLLKWITSWFH